MDTKLTLACIWFAKANASLMIPAFASLKSTAMMMCFFIVGYLYKVTPLNDYLYYKKFSILEFLKKAISILCLTALLLTTSSISYYYWIEEKLHEQAVFAKIEEEGIENIGSYEQNHLISIHLKEKNKLPEGYAWEEEGREFSYKGMFYDIVSLKQTTNGWDLVAASDEEEAVLIAHKNSSKKESSSFKLSRIQLVYLAPDNMKQSFVLYNTITKYVRYKTRLFNTSLIKFSPPPEAI